MKKLVMLFCFTLITLGVSVHAGASQISYVGGHMTFTYWENGPRAMWGEEIDVVNVWEVTQLSTPQGKNKIQFQSVFSSIDVGPDYNGIPGMPMADGPFMGSSASFDFELTQNQDGLTWSGNGWLTMYDPLGNVINPKPQDPNAGGDQVSSWWNGQFGDTGQYNLTQRNSNYFQNWTVGSITTYPTAGLYTIPTNDILYETEVVTSNNGNKRYWKNDKNYKDGVDERVPSLDASGATISTNDITFFVPAAAVVPEPTSLSLLALGLLSMGLTRMRRK
jgi:hypothetical protein